MTTEALADTSFFIALEKGRTVKRGLADALFVSIVTVAELRVGVLIAEDTGERIARLRTYEVADSLTPLLIDHRVADAWSELRLSLARQDRTLGVNDSWIAATAISHGLPVVTQDADFDGIPFLEVIRI